MQRSTLATAVVALLCVLAVAFAAAAIQNPTAGGGSVGNQSEDFGFATPPDPPEVADYPDIPSWLSRLFLALSVVGALVAVATFVRHPVETLRYVLMAAAPLVIIAALLFLLDLFQGSGDLAFDGGPGSGPTSEGEPGGSLSLLGLDPAVFAVVVAVVVLTVVLIARYQQGTPGFGVFGDDGTEEDSPTAALGAIAGDTADRIEAGADEPVENEVYRAWREMTDRLDVSSPATSTPAEFASAAVEAGMDERDVAELTDLFRSVRYGDAEPTAEREDRAVDVLRRIESAYAEEEA